MEKYSKIGLPALIGALVLFVFAVKTFVNIGYGEAGVLFKTFGGGVVTDQAPLGEGFHIIAPWNKVFIYNVKQQEFFEGNMQVLSSNGLEISLDVSVLYQPKYSELGLLHKTKGEKRREASRAGRARWLKKQKQLEIKFQREERNQFRKKKKTNKRNNRLAKS